MSNENKVKGLVREMAKFTMFAGKLSDVQLKNIKMFPLVFFNGVKEISIDYNLDPGISTVNYELDQKDANIKYDIQAPPNKTSIIYNLTIDETGDNSNLEKRFEALENSLANLLWTGIKVTVFFNNKQVYESKNGK